MNTMSRKLPQQLTSTALIAFAIALPTAPAHAELYANYCWGSPDELDTNGLHETRNTFTLPDASNPHKAYKDSIWEWNLVSAQPVYASYVQNDTTINHGDWANEISLVNASTIGGANGLTVYRHVNICTEPGHHGNYSEADVMVANHLDFQRPNEEEGVNKSGMGGGRMTFLHEVGHQLGLGHFGSFNAMNTANVRPLSAAGHTPFSPMPNDVWPLISLYGHKGNTNLIVSAQNQGPNFTVVRNLPAGVLLFCPQSPLTVRMTVANLGANALTFNQRITLIRKDGLVVNLLTWNGGTVNGHNFHTWVVDVSLANIPAGEYTVHHHADHDFRHAEWEEDDNHVRQSSTFVMFPPQWC